MTRESFLLNALKEAKNEMASSNDVKTILDAYLLSAIGALGVTCGFVFSIDRKTLTGNVAQRGMPQPEIALLQQSAADILERYFSDNVRELTGFTRELSIVPEKQIRMDPYCPSGIQFLIRWSSDFSGLAGFGETLTGALLDDIAIRFLSDHTANLMHFLDKLGYMAEQARLKSLISEKEHAADRVKKESDRVREKLDRQIFHLNSLYDMSSELNALKDVNQVINTFLLMLTGLFGMEFAYVLLVDPADKTGRMAWRSPDQEDASPMSSNDVRELTDILSKMPFSRTPVFPEMATDPRLLKHSLFPKKADTGYLFAVDQDWICLVGIGTQYDRSAYSENDHTLLQALCVTFAKALETTKSFQIIRTLNDTLEQQNRELNRTLSELKTSTRKIEVLELAKDRISALIQGEIKRSARLAFSDVWIMLILGIILGTVFNVANPSGIALIPAVWSNPSIKRIALLPARARIESGDSILVDARPAEFFDREHIPEAINMPLALFDFVYMMRFGAVNPEKEIIIYGRNISRHYDEEVAIKLANRGHSNIFILDGGLPTWAKNRYPLEASPDS